MKRPCNRKPQLLEAHSVGLLAPCYCCPTLHGKFYMIYSFFWPLSSSSPCVSEMVILNSVSLPWLEIGAHLHILEHTHLPIWQSAFYLLWFCLPFTMTMQGCLDPFSHKCVCSTFVCLMSRNLHPGFISTQEIFVNHRHHIVVSNFFWNISTSLCIWSASHLHS